MRKVAVIHWPLIDYQDAWERQASYQTSLIHQKRQYAKGKIRKKLLPHKLILCEHNHVYTLGKSGKESNLLMTRKQRKAAQVNFYKINRGVDITYHGPGQLVVYPILDLDEFYTDVHRYVRTLEELVIRVLSEYGLGGIRIKNYTGVWLPKEGHKPLRKLCAIGVHLSRWVSMHGLAFNVNTQLDYFGGIVPCGISPTDKAVSSLAKELNTEVDLSEIKKKLIKHFQILFDCEFID